MKHESCLQSLNAFQMVLQIIKSTTDESELEEMRGLLLAFNDRRMQKHLDKTVAEKGYQAADFDKILRQRS